MLFQRNCIITSQSLHNLQCFNAECGEFWVLVYSALLCSPIKSRSSCLVHGPSRWRVHSYLTFLAVQWFCYQIPLPKGMSQMLHTRWSLGPDLKDLIRRIFSPAGYRSVYSPSMAQICYKPNQIPWLVFWKRKQCFSKWYVETIPQSLPHLKASRAAVLERRYLGIWCWFPGTEDYSWTE